MSGNSGETSPDGFPAGFRHVLGHFCSGITIVTAVLDGVPVGLTCQSFFSLSLDPPLVAFSPARTSTSYPSIRKAGAFCINVLAEDQKELCRGFARSGTDKWAGVEWRAGPTGSPIIAHSLAWIDCRLETEHEAGDHFLTVGRVIQLEATQKRPLLYFHGDFAHLAAHSDGAAPPMA